MRSGMLRQRLALQSLQGAVSDGMGGTTGGVWTPVTTLWGHVAPLSGAERLRAAQIDAEVTHEIAIRYRAGVVPKMRLQRTQAGAQIYEIHAVLNPELRNTQLTLLCSEVQVTGA